MESNKPQRSINELIREYLRGEAPLPLPTRLQDLLKDPQISKLGEDDEAFEEWKKRNVPLIQLVEEVLRNRRAQNDKRNPPLQNDRSNLLYLLVRHVQLLLTDSAVILQALRLQPMLSIGHAPL